jgi:hypothetical protein
MDEAEGAPGPRDNLPTEAVNHAWQWFALHAGQRMQCVNYFLVAAAFLVAGFSTAISAKNSLLAAAIALVGAWLSWLFNRLEIRTRELVKAGEAPLRRIEERLASAAQLPDLRIVESIETPATRWTFYSFVINAIHRTALVSFLAGAVYAVAREYWM